MSTDHCTCGEPPYAPPCAYCVYMPEPDELREAWKELREENHDLREWNKDLRAALAKAKSLGFQFSPVPEPKRRKTRVEMIEIVTPEDPIADGCGGAP